MSLRFRSLPRLRLLSPGLFAALLPLPHALAQTSSGSAARENQLPTVNVTAKGHTADTLETPAAVLVLDRADLFRRGAANVAPCSSAKTKLACPSGTRPNTPAWRRFTTVLLQACKRGGLMR